MKEGRTVLGPVALLGGPCTASAPGLSRLMSANVDGKSYLSEKLGKEPLGVTKTRLLDDPNESQQMSLDLRRGTKLTFWSHSWRLTLMLS
jgi:hypothetical protein